MFEDYVPKRKIGTLCPLAVIDNHAYEFYQLVPRGVMLVMVRWVSNNSRRKTWSVFLNILTSGSIC